MFTADDGSRAALRAIGCCHRSGSLPTGRPLSGGLRAKMGAKQSVYLSFPTASAAGLFV